MNIKYLLNNEIISEILNFSLKWLSKIPIVIRILIYISIYDKENILYYIKNRIPFAFYKIFKKRRVLLITVKRIKKSNVHNISKLLYITYSLLIKDRIVGSWGRTLKKYFHITQDEAKWDDYAKYKYLICGSSTHTYHALNGIVSYLKYTKEHFDISTVNQILSYLELWRIQDGSFPTPVVNFDGSRKGFLERLKVDPEHANKEIPGRMRHTSSCMLVMNRIKAIYRLADKNSIHKDYLLEENWKNILHETNEFNLKATSWLSHNVNAIDTSDTSDISGPDYFGEVRYTPAYLLKAIDENLQKYKSELHIKDYVEIIKSRNNIIDYIIKFSFKDSEENYFCEYSNSFACYYYSLLLLQTLLDSKAFITTKNSETFIRKLLLKLTKELIKKKGIGFGISIDGKKKIVEKNDLGVTCRYIVVLVKYSRIYGISDDIFHDGFRTAINYVLQECQKDIGSSLNLMTHGWESILLLLDYFDKPLVKEITNIIDKRMDTYNSAIVQISNRIFKGCTHAAWQNRFKRLIIWPDPLKLD